MPDKAMSKVIWLLRQLQEHDGKFRAVINDTRVVRYLELLGYQCKPTGVGFSGYCELHWFYIVKGKPVAPWED
jgi:hypothetical protein